MLACWGKLGDANESESYHPLLCHMLDVASVAREMWRSTLSPRLRRETTEALGFLEDQDAAGVWCAFLAGLHDLGKAFQFQVERVREPVKNRLRSVGLRVDRYHAISRTPHGTITAATPQHIDRGVRSKPVGRQLIRRSGWRASRVVSYKPRYFRRHLDRPWKRQLARLAL